MAVAGFEDNRWRTWRKTSDGRTKSPLEEWALELDTHGRHGVRGFGYAKDYLSPVATRLMTRIREPDIIVGT